jgi:nitrate reductase alpha subunit
VARQFADNADKTRGKSMVIIGAAMNHWYHSDMNYRGIINMLMMCGCIGQERWRLGALRGPGKAAPPNRLDRAGLCARLGAPTAPDEQHQLLLRAHRPVALRKTGCGGNPLAAGRQEQYGGSLIDYNVRAERMGWLPSAPQLQTNPMQVVKDAQAAGMDPKDYVVQSLKDGSLKMSCEDPDHPANWPRNMFVWRSNLLGSSGKGHEYFLKHLLGTTHGVQGKDLGPDDAKPAEVQWHARHPKASWICWSRWTSA